MTAESPPPRPAYRQSAEVAGEGYGEWLPPATPRQRTSIADSLEPGALRDELRGSPAQPIGAPAPVLIERFRFTGEGREYFRIWIVNLLLTLLTLGVYSAWAKVRKTRYFWQNTRLHGHVFDYHGRPVAILAGRAIALLLLVGYSVAGEFSPVAGLAMIVLLCVVGPWLFMRAQRFKLANTSWRGLRFGFDTRAMPAYRAVLPPMLIWFSGAILAVVMAGNMGLLSAAGLVSAGMLPWMHHRLKAYQHGSASFGDRRFTFLPATPGFYAIYFKAALIAASGLVLGILVLMAGAFAWLSTSGGQPPPAALFVAMAVVGLFGWLVAWPYFAARLQALVWSHTHLDALRFSTAIAAWPLLRLVAVNVGLTLVTAGLYWPFASVALARYRVECMRVQSPEPLEPIAAATSAAPGFAGGDAAADVFGLDIGL